MADRYARVARLFGWQGDDDQDGAAYADRGGGAHGCGPGHSDLRELGVPEAMIPMLARDALGPASNCNSNPVPVDADAGAEGFLLDAY